MFKNIAPAICMFVLSIMLSFVPAKADDITTETFHVTVDERENLELIKAYYYCAPPKDLKLFKPGDGAHECKIVLRSFSAEMTVEEATESFISIPLSFSENLAAKKSIDEAVNVIKDREHLRPATPNEVIMLGISYPELNTQYIIAPGELVDKDGHKTAINIYYNCVGTIRTDGKMKSHFLLAFVILE
jgi:hypothetical protein